MKAEQRHKLETNELADWLGQAIKKVEPYRRTILAAVVLLTLGVAVVLLLPKYRARASAASWEQFYHAIETGNVAELEQIAEDQPGLPVAHWALVVAADARLATACMQLFTDKTSAALELRKAIEAYTTVIDQSKESRLVEQALFGRARAYEAISGTQQGTGELPKAVADYQRLAQGWPTGPYATMATEQLKRLDAQSTRIFYDKFAAYTPKRPVSREPEGPGKTIPFDSSALPDDEKQSEFSKLLNLSDLKVKGPSTKGEPGEAGSKAAVTTEGSKAPVPAPQGPRSEATRPPDAKASGQPESSKAGSGAMSPPAGSAPPALPTPSTPPASPAPSK